MKDVCENCRFRKKCATRFCTKYGIPIWTPKVYCVSKEPERGQEDVADRLDEVPRTDNGS